MRKGTGLISTPTPRAPKSFAAAITMRPSPQPKSYTTSPGPVPASLSIPSTASSVLGKYGTSGSKTGATPSVSEVSPPSSSAAQPETSAAARTIVRDSSLRTGPPPSKQHDDGSRRQHADADERPHARVGEARIEQIKTGEDEQKGRHREKRYAKRPLPLGLVGAQHEQGKPDQQKKRPENGGGVIHHGLEVLARERAEQNQAERDRGLEDIGVARRAARAVPAGEKGEERPFLSERKVRTGADDDGRVDGSERGNRDDQADQPRAVFAPDAREEVGSDDVRLAHRGHAKTPQIRDIDEHIEHSDYAQGQEQRPDDIAIAVLYFRRDIGRFIPPAVGEQHENHG